MDEPEQSAPTGGQRSGSPVLFWTLIALAAVGFVPCAVLSPWRDYQALTMAVQVEDQLTAAARADLGRLRRTAEGIRTDPAVAARLARRELSYLQPGHADVPLPGIMPVACAASRPTPVEPVQPPPPIARAVGRLPVMNYDGLFRDGPTRVILMLLSGGLVAAALVLCRPKPTIQRPGVPDTTGRA